MTTPEFQKLVTITNRVAARFNGTRDTCVLTSFALHHVLQRLGYDSHPLRIEAAVFPDDRKFYGTILGGWREPGCRRAASPGMWLGHLAVVVDLIGDLCHLAARHKMPPFKMLETGAECYVNEIVCEEHALFLDVKATLNVLARRWPHDEDGFTVGQESNEPYEVVNDESVAFWRAQIRAEYDLPPQR